MFSGMRVLTSIVGVVYPFYMSLKVLNVQNIGEMNKQDGYLWLSYWIWYGIFTTIENISDILFCWMGTMYEIIKIALFVYLYHPQTKGSLFLYHKILQPLVMQLINYEHVMILNVNTLRKNITINDQDHQQQQQPQQQQQQFGNLNDHPNISANTSKNFNIGSSNNILPSTNLNLSNKNMNSSPILNTGTNIPLTTTNIPPINPNVIPNTSNNLPTFVPFQPMAFAAITSLNNPSTNPVVSAAPLNQHASNTNANAYISNNMVTPPLQNNLQQ